MKGVGIDLADRHIDFDILYLELFPKRVSEQRQIPAFCICVSAYAQVWQLGIIKIVQVKRTYRELR
jgi:hypothetical protein